MRLTRQQRDENLAAASRERQQERLLREWNLTQAIKAVDKQTGDAIMCINTIIKKYPLTQAEYTTLRRLKGKANTGKRNTGLNIEIFKTCKVVKRKYQKLNRTNKG